MKNTKKILKNMSKATELRQVIAATAKKNGSEGIVHLSVAYSTDGF